MARKWKKLREVSNKKKKTLSRDRNKSFSEYELSKILEIVKYTLKEKISITYKDVAYILDSLNFGS